MWFLQPGITFEDVLMRILAVLIIVFLIFPLHEYAHAFIAYKLGDGTAKATGRMTFNPLAHFDPIGSMLLLFFNFGWAKPVPVNASNFKKPRRDMALVSVAGPLSNVLAALIGGFLLHFVKIFGSGEASVLIYIFLSYYVVINVDLAVFNLIPIAPLDGFGIIEAFIPQRFLVKYYQHQRVIGMIIVFALLFGFLSGPIGFLQNAVCGFIMNVTSLPFSFIA